MNDTEFELLDELYFMKTFEELEAIFGKTSFHLEQELWNLISKNWVKTLDSSDIEIGVTKEEFSDQKYNLRFNATKQGLIAHNQV